MRGEKIRKAVIKKAGRAAILPIKTGTNFLKLKIARETRTGVKVKKETMYLGLRDLPKKTIRTVLIKKNAGRILFLSFKNKYIP